MNEQNTYTISELAEMYNVSSRTINNWLKPIRKELLEMRKDQKRLRILLPKQAKRIIEFLGLP